MICVHTQNAVKKTENEVDGDGTGMPQNSHQKGMLPDP